MVMTAERVASTKSFGDWLKGEIKAVGSVDRFQKETGLTTVYAWFSGLRTPKPYQRADLAAKLSEWTGQQYTEEYINDVIDPGWRIEPANFGDWLKALIERTGSVNNFCFEHGYNQPTVLGWFSGDSFPIGKTGQLVNLAHALSEWTKTEVTAQELRSRIESDPEFQERCKYWENKLINASVEITTPGF